MTSGVRLALASALLCGMAGVLYATGPPPAHTGGFGEPNCTACHFENPVNDPGGRLRLRGLPDPYEPGKRYEIEVVLARPGLERGGFQLSARSSAGTQAGILLFDKHSSAVDSLAGVQYVRHTDMGSVPPSPDSIAWRIAWQAPDAGVDSVVFNVAANAANDDNSEFGDFIYVLEARTRAR